MEDGSARSQSGSLAAAEEIETAGVPGTLVGHTFRDGFSAIDTAASTRRTIAGMSCLGLAESRGQTLVRLTHRSNDSARRVHHIQHEEC